MYAVFLYILFTVKVMLIWRIVLLKHPTTHIIQSSDKLFCFSLYEKKGKSKLEILSELTGNLNKTQTAPKYFELIKHYNSKNFHLQ